MSGPTKFPLEQVVALELNSVVDKRRFGGIPEHEMQGVIRRELARRLADLLATSSAVRFTEGRPDRGGAIPVYARLWVVERESRTSLEARIAARQGDVARETIEEAIGQLDLAYPGDSAIIRKDRVAAFLRRSLANVIERHEKQGAA